MAIASVEISWVKPVASVDVQVHAKCVRQEQLAISGSTATMASAVASADLAESLGAGVARVASDDTGCYVAVGTTPDPTLTAATAVSSARRYLPAGGEITLPIAVGEKVAVHS